MNRFKVAKTRLPLFACLVSSVLTLPFQSVVAQSTAPAGGSGATYTAPGYGQYPRVTEIEQQLLGQTYEKDPLAARVARLETKQFGKPSPKDDLADRLDKLDQFVKPKPEPQDDSAAIEAAQNGGGANYAGGSTSGAGRSAGATAATGGTSTASAGGPSGHVSTDAQYSASDYGNYPRVTELEQQFLGATYVKDPLPVRIARLETKKLGKTSPDDELCDRIDRLDKLAPKQSSRMVNNDQDDSNGNSSNSNNNGKSGKGGGIGRALLGMLGNSLGGGMGGGGLGGMGGGGMGLAGLGSSLMGNNMGAMMPGLQDDMRKDAAEKNRQQSGGASGGSSRVPSRGAVASSSPFAADAPPTYGTENRVAAIEKFVLGKEHSELPLEERIAHVEKKLVPYEHNQAGKGVGVRVDHLWSILAAANKSTKSLAAAGSTE